MLSQVLQSISNFSADLNKNLSIESINSKLDVLSKDQGHAIKNLDDAAEETEKEIDEDGIIEFENEELVYAQKGDAKYNSVMDANGDGKITYKEYLDYCFEFARESRENTRTTVEKNDKEGKIEISNIGRAIDEYTRTEEPEGRIETEG